MARPIFKRLNHTKTIATKYEFIEKKKEKIL